LHLQMTPRVRGLAGGVQQQQHAGPKLEVIA
jgi:hypothetical protein